MIPQFWLRGKESMHLWQFAQAMQQSRERMSETGKDRVQTTLETIAIGGILAADVRPAWNDQVSSRWQKRIVQIKTEWVWPRSP
jgi:hypothetical protein